MAPNLSPTHREAERQFIESLRERYEEAGFRFTAHPRSDELPDFLGSYLPDALAQRPGRNIVIEVKRRPMPSTERSLVDIRRLFDGHPDWQFRVAFIGNDPLQSLALAAAAPDVLRDRIDEARSLLAAGYRRPALVMAWSLLEAALRTRTDATDGRAQAPGTLVHTLAMQGYIEPETERRLRSLIETRSRIVHGDLAVEPAPADVEQVLSAVEETLRSDAS